MLRLPLQTARLPNRCSCCLYRMSRAFGCWRDMSKTWPSGCDAEKTPSTCGIGRFVVPNESCCRGRCQVVCAVAALHEAAVSQI